MQPTAALEPDWVIAKAKELGFDLCGVAGVEELADTTNLEQWLARGFAGEMRYLRDPRRSDPARVVPGARSVIVCALNYQQAQPYSTEAAAVAAAGSAAQGWISRYAWGEDYHVVLGDRLAGLTCALRERFGNEFAARAYVDTGPVSERAAAKVAGLGWLGKNTCLINKDAGSWLFLGVIVTSLAPASWAEVSAAPDLCGNCRLCLDACPTGALIEPYTMDARRCISYLTIELRGSIPEEFRPGIGWQVFGCDICQDVCPWNGSRSPGVGKTQEFAGEDPFAPRQGLLAPELEWLLSLTEDEFRKQFRGSPVKRTKWRGLLRNACVAAGNALAKAAARAASGPAEQGGQDDPEMRRLCEQLERLAASDHAEVAEHARWALSRRASSGRPLPPGDGGAG